MRIILKEGHDVVGYYDHHWPEPGRTKIITELSKRLDVLNNVEHLNYVTRQEAASATELVPDGEWHDKFIDVVFFDLDIDGFLGFLRGCGVDYPNIVQDARLVDSPNNNGNISRLGGLILNSKFLAPNKDSNDPKYFTILEKVYSKFIDRVSGKMSAVEQLQYEKEIQNAVSRGKNPEGFKEIVECAHVYKGGLLFLDCIPVYKKGGHPDIRTMVTAAIKRLGDEEPIQAVARTFLQSNGDHGVRIDVQQTCTIDLDKVWPMARNPFRCTCQRFEFPKFARAWAMANGYVFGKRGRKAS